MMTAIQFFQKIAQRTPLPPAETDPNGLRRLEAPLLKPRHNLSLKISGYASNLTQGKHLA